MTEEQLKEYLKEHLKISVYTDWYDNTIRVALLLDDKEISFQTNDVQVRSQERGYRD